MRAQFALFILAMLALAGAVSALPVQVELVEANDVPIISDASNALNVLRSDELDLKVVFVSSEDLENVQVRADIAGYEYNDNVEERLSDLKFLGKVEKDVQYPVKLNIPLNMDVEVDRYVLTLTISNRGDSFQQVYNFKIDTQRRDLQIVDFHYIPMDKIKAGQALLAKVRVDNLGQVDEKDVRVTVSIPELGVQQRAYINEVKSGDQEQTEEMYLKVPLCSEAKVYDVKVDVEYSRRKASQVYPLQVLENELCESKDEEQMLEVVLGSQLKSVETGEKASFPITLTNKGKNAESYTLTAQAPEGVEVSFTPSTTVVVQGGQTQQVHLWATAEDVEGTQVIRTTLNNGGQALSELSFTLDVEAKSSILKTALEGVLVVLVVLLVLLGLVIGFSRLKDDGKGKSEPYY